MAKRSDVPRNSKRRVKPDEVSTATTKKVAVSGEPKKGVLLRINFNARYITYGSVSGKRYEFNGAGSVVEVLPEDAEAFINKISKGSCCGSDGGKIFEVVEN